MSNYQHSCEVIAKIKRELDMSNIGINEAWEQLYHELPYNYIAQSDEILELITNLSADDYPQQLSMLEDLIYQVDASSSAEDIKKHYKYDNLEGLSGEKEYLEDILKVFNVQTDDWKLYMYDFQVEKFREGDFKCALLGYLLQNAPSFEVVLDCLKMLQKWCDFFQYRTLNLIVNSLEKSYKNKFFKEYVLKNTSYCLYSLKLPQKKKTVKLLMGLIDNKEDLYVLLNIIDTEYFSMNRNMYNEIITCLKDDNLVNDFKKWHEIANVILEGRSEDVELSKKEIEKHKNIVAESRGDKTKASTERIVVDVENSRLKENSKNIYEIQGERNPERRGSVVNRIVRKSNLVQALKELYNNTCQICGCRLEIRKGIYYSEVHHIRPLGSIHQGSDTVDNTIVLCSNCHTLFDRGSIGIDEKELLVIHFDKNNRLHGRRVLLKHTLGVENLIYHNTRICSSQEVSKQNIQQDYSKKKTTFKKIEQEEELGDVVDFNNEVIIEDVELREELKIKMNSYWEQHTMPPIQKVLLNKRVGECVEYGEFTYSIISIN